MQAAQLTLELSGDGTSHHSTARSAADGTWQFHLPEIMATAGTLAPAYTITVTYKGEPEQAIRLQDVLFGDVFVW